MGGRGASSTTSKVTVMSEDEYLGLKGVGSVLSGYMDDKVRLPNGETLRQREKRYKEHDAAMAAHAEKRKAARAEYKVLVDSGKLRPPTWLESSLKTAHGESGNEAVQAARRVLTKRGYDWKTGKKL